MADRSFTASAELAHYRAMVAEHQLRGALSRSAEEREAHRRMADKYERRAIEAARSALRGGV